MSKSTEKTNKEISMLKFLRRLTIIDLYVSQLLVWSVLQYKKFTAYKAKKNKELLILTHDKFYYGELEREEQTLKSIDVFIQSI